MAILGLPLPSNANDYKTPSTTQNECIYDKACQPVECSLAADVTHVQLKAQSGVGALNRIEFSFLHILMLL